MLCPGLLSRCGAPRVRLAPRTRRPGHKPFEHDPRCVSSLLDVVGIFFAGRQIRAIRNEYG